MGKEVIAIAFSDLHINLWAKFNENNHRTLNSFRFCRLYGNYVEGLTVLHYFVETYFIRPKQWTKN